jgi:hypothetical protein
LSSIPCQRNTKRRNGIRKDERLLFHIPPVIKARGGSAGRKYRDALYLKKVRRIMRTINQMRKKDSSRNHNPFLRFHKEIDNNGRSTDQGANSPQILTK